MTVFENVLVAGTYGSADQLSEAAAVGIRKAMVSGEGHPPMPDPPQEAEIDFVDDLDELWAGCAAAYAAGSLREDDLLLDPRFSALADKYDLADLLRIRRGFGG